MARLRWFAFFLLAGALTWAQSTPQYEQQQSSTDQRQPRKVKSHSGAAHDVGSGAANVGTGAAKGAGSLAKGTANGAVDLVTLHPIDAGVSVGRGAVGAGKDVAVGTTKGTYKVTRGIAKGIRKLF